MSMARKALGPASLQVAQALRDALTGVPEATVGCSGGPDSLALALGAAWAGQRTGTSVRAVIVDHQLQDGSHEVAQQARAQLAGHDVPAVIVTVHVDPGDPNGPEAAARAARRAALLQHAGGGPVLLGHTLDDQAETVLLGLARGSGARSLSGMRPRSGRFWHPLLGVRRATTVQACREWQVAPWHDPQNADPSFLRSRVRTELMGQLTQVLGEGAIVNLARSAELLASDDEALNSVVTWWFAGGGTSHEQQSHVEQFPPGAPIAGNLPVSKLHALPGGLAGRVVKAWLEHRDVHPLRVHVQAVLGLVDGPGGTRVDLPGGAVRKEHGELVWRASS